MSQTGHQLLLVLICNICNYALNVIVSNSISNSKCHMPLSLTPVSSSNSSESSHNAAWAHFLLASTVVAPLADSSRSQQSSSTLSDSSEQSLEKQTGSSLWNCFDTIIHDVSATDESATDEGNCINAELDQYLSEPLTVVRMILLPGGRRSLTGFVTWRHWPRNSWHHHLPVSLQSGSSVQLVMSSVNIAAVFCQKMQRHWFSWSTTPTYWTLDLTQWHLMRNCNLKNVSY